MRRLGWSCLGLIGLLCQGLPASAQNTLDALQQDLNQVKQEHQDSSSQVFSTFIDELDKASQSPDAALSLYQTAGGDMPDAAPVITRYTEETPDEKDARLALDQANTANLACVAQLHCGLMRYAALLIQNPDKKELHNDWIAWIKTAAQLYPQTAATPADTRDASESQNNNGKNNKHGNRPKKKDDGGNKAKELKDKAVSDSIISSYLGFHSWDKKEQGQWKVGDLPKLYRKEILDPLRAAHNPEVLGAWDVYIAMCQADQPDQDQWEQVDYPSLEFDRATDDFILTPTTEKVAAMAAIVKANPDHPKFEDMLSRTNQMIDALRKMKAGGPAPTFTPTPADKS
ncbi:hypothetical protein OAG63_00235 [Methylacidiphilales bacterium]|nr:hypothetical protein [Candidatus Methylacidiphilales bacterium]